MDRLLQLGDLNPPGVISDQDTLRREAREIVASVQGNWLFNQQALQALIKDLPSLSEADISSLGHHDALCPICFVPLLSIITEEEMAQAMDSPAHPLEELGVTRLSQTCGHIFCRKDISKWILTNHDTCPTCRTPLITSTDTRPIEMLPDRAISDRLSLIEQTMLGSLDQLRQIREVVQQLRGVSENPEATDHPQTPPANTPLDVPSPTSSLTPSNPPGVSDGYFGMYP